MKLLVSFLTVLSLNVFADTGFESIDNGWKKLTNVCISSGYDPARARKTCEFNAQVVTLMSTEEVTFQASCEAGKLEDSMCQFGYWLHTKVIVLDPAE